MAKVRWGVLSTARIGVERVIPGLKKGAYSKVVAIASREFNKASRVARELDLPKAYDSYEELLSDPDVEAIYNPLPNHLHVPWSIKALEAGSALINPVHLQRNRGGRERGRCLSIQETQDFAFRQSPEGTVLALAAALGILG